MFSKQNILLTISTLVFLFELRIANKAVAQDLKEFSNYTTITDENWLSKGIINCTLIDKRGFLWVGTTSGLYKYNGYGAENYSDNKEKNLSLFNNGIQALTEDKYGNIWVGTARGLGIIELNSEKFTLFKDEKNITLVAAIDETLWIANKEDILIKVEIKQFKDHKNIEFKPFLSKEENKKLGSRVFSIIKNQEDIILGTNNGLFILNITHKKAEASNFKNPIIDVLNKNKNQLWVGTDNKGLFLLERKGNNFRTLKQINLGQQEEGSYNKVKFIKQLNAKNIIFATYNHLYQGTITDQETIIKPILKNSVLIRDNNLLCASIDEKENFWIGTLHGIYKIRKQNYLFNKIKLSTSSYIPINNHVKNLFKDSFGYLWVVTFKDGLFRYHPNNKNVEHFKLPGLEPSFLAQSKSGSLYFVSSTNLYKVKNYTGSFQSVSDKTLIATDKAISCMLEIEKDTWWVGVWNGGVQYLKDDKFQSNPFLQKVRKEVQPDVNVLGIVKDLDGNIWIAKRRGGIVKVNLKTKTIKSYTEAESSSNGLLSDKLLSVFVDSKGNVWVGTRGGGLCLYNKYKDNFKTFTTKSGLPSNTICAIQEDKFDNIWVSTLNGIAKYLPGQIIPFRAYDTEEGIIYTEFTFNTVVKDNEGDLYFGNTDGLYHLKSSPYEPAKTKSPFLWVNFEILSSNKKNLSLTNQSLIKTVQQKGVITLDYKFNSFKIIFSSLDFSSNKILYAYRLKGLNENWTYVNSTKKSVEFINVPSGSYVFEVKNSDGEGYWTKTSNAIKITINAPIWASNTAFILYAIFILGSIIIICFFWKRWFVLQKTLKEETEALHLQSQQMVFFTDLSHEIKNRLSLILGPLENALKGKKVNKTILYNLYEQAQRLKRISDQIVNIRKSDSGEFILRVKEGNILKHIQQLVKEIEPLAVIKDVHLNFESQENINGWFDNELLEIVLLNLITNAIKYSSTGSTVNVYIAKKYFDNHSGPNNFSGNFLYCCIEDNGIGIPAKDLNKITNEFYRADNVKLDKEKYDGTGLGLNLVSRLTNVHHGWMTINSEEKKFTKIEFYIPLDKEQYALHELSLSLDYAPILEYVDNLEKPKNASIKHLVKNEKEKILIVDDEILLRKLIKDSLSEHQIFEAANGEEALKLIAQHAIDFIITDLNMPIMNGLELLKTVKTSDELNHIPVVILTAKNSHEEKLICLQNDADDFIEKPFSPQLLSWRVNNLLANRKLLKNKFSKHIHIEPQPTLAKSVDEKFIEDVVNLIEKNINNYQLDVEFLVAHLFMSRATIYRKMEDLLNQSPSAFIRQYKLKKAVLMLNKKEFYIAEIAFKTGFKSPQSFTKSFLKEFGITPSAYVKENIDSI
jgi:signal transduction histidine kinase/ligand-binding sensor domain-containing protein/DNA-binding response OmpR family regulator